MSRNASGIGSLLVAQYPVIDLMVWEGAFASWAELHGGGNLRLHHALIPPMWHSTAGASQDNRL